MANGYIAKVTIGFGDNMNILVSIFLVIIVLLSLQSALICLCNLIHNVIKVP